MEMESRRFDFEGGFAQLRQIEVDRVIGRWADRGGHAGKDGQCRPMDVPGCDHLHTRVMPHDRGKLS